MSKNVRDPFRQRFSISELDFEIRMMEVELDYHHEQSKIFEDAIREKQRQLERLQPSLRPSNILEGESSE